MRLKKNETWGFIVYKSLRLGFILFQGLFLILRTSKGQHYTMEYWMNGKGWYDQGIESTTLGTDVYVGQPVWRHFLVNLH